MYLQYVSPIIRKKINKHVVRSEARGRGAKRIRTVVVVIVATQDRTNQLE
jgi:hypothetical protein